MRRRSLLSVSLVALLPFGAEATSIALGGLHSCALLTGGKVKCWGINSVGQLGDGTTTQRYTPVEVSGMTNAQSIALGSWHSCALLTNRKVKCWGGNSNGQLGDGTTTRRTTPVEVSGLYPLPPPPSSSQPSPSSSDSAAGGAAFVLAIVAVCWLT